MDRVFGRWRGRFGGCRFCSGLGFGSGFCRSSFLLFSDFLFSGETGFLTLRQNLLDQRLELVPVRDPTGVLAQSRVVDQVRENVLVEREDVDDDAAGGYEPSLGRTAEQGVLFTGDVLFHQCTPIGWEGTFGQWIAALERLGPLTRLSFDENRIREAARECGSPDFLHRQRRFADDGFGEIA